MIGALFYIGERIIKTVARGLPKPEGIESALMAFRYFENPGIAFGIEIPLVLIILLSIIALVLIVRRYIQPSIGQTEAFFLISILVGGLNNLYDRIAYGHVIDYILLFGRSAVNLSDALILIGLLGLFYIYSKHANVRGI